MLARTATTLAITSGRTLRTAYELDLRSDPRNLAAIRVELSQRDLRRPRWRLPDRLMSSSPLRRRAGVPEPTHARASSRSNAPGGQMWYDERVKTKGQVVKAMALIQ